MTPFVKFMPYNIPFLPFVSFVFFLPFLPFFLVLFVPFLFLYLLFPRPQTPVIDQAAQLPISIYYTAQLPNTFDQAAQLPILFDLAAQLLFIFDMTAYMPYTSIQTILPFNQFKLLKITRKKRVPRARVCSAAASGLWNAFFSLVGNL